MPGGTCCILWNLPQFLAASKIFEVNNTMIIIYIYIYYNLTFVGVKGDAAKNMTVRRSKKVKAR